MVSIQQYGTQGKKYWRIVESYRGPDGRPRIRTLLHLGTASQALQKLQAGGWQGVQIKSYEHGTVAALAALADELGVARTIDARVPASRHGLSVGTTILLAILGRCIHPTSKRGWNSWAQTTSLERIFPGLDASELTSQYFWDQMDLIPEAALEAMEAELTKRVVEQEHLALDTLLYDTTNWFTFIASTNARNTIAKRGHNKQRRNDLRQVGVALLVSRDHGIPLASRTYQGNSADSKLFPDSLTLIRKRLQGLVADIKDVTIVYDRGNNSRANQGLVDASDVGYVAALTPYQHHGLMARPLSEYAPIPDGKLAGTPALKLKEKVWGADRTIVLYVSERLKQGQVRGLRQHLEKAVAELQAWQESLALPRSGGNPAAAAKRLEKILQRQHLNLVLQASYDPAKKGAHRLMWRQDDEAVRHLESEVYGKRILMTNRHDWSAEKIIEAYHGQSTVERVFRDVKDEDHVSLRPQFHWTDQKIRVHVFMCLVSLMLSRILEKRSREAGLPANSDAIWSSLAQIRLLRGVTLPGLTGGRPRVEWRLEAAQPQDLRLYEALVPEASRIAYTSASPQKTRSTGDVRKSAAQPK